MFLLHWFRETIVFIPYIFETALLPTTEPTMNFSFQKQHEITSIYCIISLTNLDNRVWPRLNAMSTNIICLARLRAVKYFQITSLLLKLLYQYHLLSKYTCSVVKETKPLLHHRNLILYWKFVHLHLTS
jgi:hypothetical protein